MNQYVFKVVHDNSAEGFTVMYNDFPFEVPSARRDRILDSVAHTPQQKGDQITAVKRISLNGVAARELTITRASNPPLVMKVRIFLNKQRLYQVMAVTSRNNAASPKVSRFLNSFSLADKP